MLEFLNHIDHELFLFLNGLSNPLFDSVMSKATKSMLWIPLYIVFLFFVIRQYKWHTILVVVITAILILVSDQLANLAKATFERLRPSHEPGLPVHIVNAYKGGMYGFYSSHASNSFSLAVFLIVILIKRFRWIWMIAIPWALLMSYTRIYLGVHFPGDVLMGIVMGCLIGYFLGKSALYFLSCFSSRFFLNHNRHSRAQ